MLPRHGITLSLSEYDLEQSVDFWHKAKRVDQKLFLEDTKVGMADLEKMGFP